MEKESQPVVAKKSDIHSKNPDTDKNLISMLLKALPVLLWILIGIKTGTGINININLIGIVMMVLVIAVNNIRISKRRKEFIRDSAENSRLAKPLREQHH